MSKKLRAILRPLIVVLLVTVFIFLAVQWLIGDDLSKRAAASRSDLVARLEKLSLPDMARTSDPPTMGCNGLDFNDCAILFYNSTDDPASLAAKLEGSLSGQGFTVYRHDGPNRLDAFSNGSAMYLQFFLTGDNKVQVIVGEASNGRYAPS